MLVLVGYCVGGKVCIEGEFQCVFVVLVDGFLKVVVVCFGDCVKKGELFVELVDQDLLFEQCKWEGEQVQQDSVYVSVLVGVDCMVMMIVLVKVDEVWVNLGFVEVQLQCVCIVVFFDGVVMEGDFIQSLGVFVQCGKVFMVLVLGDSCCVVVEIDECDIVDVCVGQVGWLLLLVLFWDVLFVWVICIVLIVCVVDGVNVFDVEIEVMVDVICICFGFEGVVKIEVGWCILVWVWLYCVIDWFCMFLWVWVG